MLGNAVHLLLAESRVQAPEGAVLRPYNIILLLKSCNDLTSPPRNERRVRSELSVIAD